MGSAINAAAPRRLISSSAMATRHAQRRLQTIAIATRHVKSANSKVNAESAAMKSSPPSANGAAASPAMSQETLWRSISTNAASGRLEVSGLVNRLHHLGIDVDRERAARVVHDPHVQHRRRADADRAERTCGRRRQKTELEAER